MQWIRWFGLDTVFSVVAVQLFLQQLIAALNPITWLALPWQPRYFIWSTGDGWPHGCGSAIVSALGVSTPSAVGVGVLRCFGWRVCILLAAIFIAY